MYLNLNVIFNILNYIRDVIFILKLFRVATLLDIRQQLFL